MHLEFRTLCFGGTAYRVAGPSHGGGHSRGIPEGFTPVSSAEAKFVLRQVLATGSLRDDEYRRLAASFEDSLRGWKMYRGPRPEGTEVRAEVVDLVDMSPVPDDPVVEPERYWVAMSVRGDEGERIDGLTLEVVLPDGRTERVDAASASQLRFDKLTSEGNVEVRFLA